MNDELWGVGRTFILAVIIVVATVVLMAIGKIPDVISLGDWTAFTAPLLGLFAAKSVGHAIANSPKKEPK